MNRKQLPMSQTPQPTVRPRSVLLVDDEVNQVVILKAGLAKLPNCEVSVATSGRQALALCARQSFDLIITDYHMPEMDGLTLAAVLHQQYPATVIIMLTAFGNEVLCEQVADNPVQLVLEKPIDLKYIRAVVWQALARFGAPDDSEAARA
jgi:two-component system sensor histidine kinase EvgS